MSSSSNEYETITHIQSLSSILADYMSDLKVTKPGLTEVQRRIFVDHAQNQVIVVMDCKKE